MKKLATILVIVLLAATIAAAQSSGSFTYNDTLNGPDVTCTLQSNGQIKGGAAVCSSGTDCTAYGCTPIPSATDNKCTGSVGAGIKTNSGSGNVFVVRPSMVIGLLTDVSLNTNSNKAGSAFGTASALAGVNVNVIVAPNGDDSCGTKTPSAACPHQAPAADQWITYNSRYIQISSPLFQTLVNTCVSDAGTGCYFTFNESTVSAHSFDWIAGQGTTLSSGLYTVTLNWESTVEATAGISEALTCVGPVNLTVQQNKVFSFNSPNN